MKYLLDTNIYIYILKGKFDLHEKLKSVGIENCAISEISLAELVYGAEYSSNPEKNNLKVQLLLKGFKLITTSNCIYEYAIQKSRLRKQGNLIPDFDLLIGSTAITENLILVTSKYKRLYSNG